MLVTKLHQHPKEVAEIHFATGGAAIAALCQNVSSLHCTLLVSLAVQCIVIGPVCVCYHDNSKLRASIFTKLGL